MSNSIQYVYNIIDKYSTPLAKISKATDKMGKSVKKASDKVGSLGDKFKTTSQKMSSFKGIVASLGAGIAIKALVQDSMKMEDAMADVAKVSSLAGDSLMGLRFDLEKLSEQVGRPAVGLAQIAFEGKKLGATDKEIIPFVKTVGKMAIAFEIAESEAGNAIGQIRAKLGYGMEDIVKFGDSANELANTMATNGKNIIEITQRMSGTFSTLKFPPGISAGFAATADMLETSPELAASGMRMMMKKLSLIPGMTTKLMANPVKTINDEMGKLARLPVEKRIQKIQKMFGPEAGRMVEKLVDKLDLFNKAMKTATDAGAVGSMDREMKNYLERSSTRLKIATEKIRNSFRRLGDALTPFVIMFGDLLAKFSKWTLEMSIKHPTLMKIATTLMLVAAAIGLLLIPIGLMASGFGALMSAGVFAFFADALIVLSGAFIAVAAATWSFTVALLANPITWIVIAVGLLVAAITRLIIKWADLKKEFKSKGLAAAVKLFFGLKKEKLKAPEVGDAMVKIKQAKVDPGAFNYFKENFSFRRMFGLDDTEITSKRVIDSSVKVKGQERQSIDVNGNINVAAEKGLKVLSAKMNTDVGTNMGFAY